MTYRVMKMILQGLIYEEPVKSGDEVFADTASKADLAEVVGDTKRKSK